MAATSQKRQFPLSEKEEKSKENIPHNIPHDGVQSKKPKNMPDFARLHESFSKQQEKFKATKKAPTVPHEFSLSATNRKEKVDPQPKTAAQPAHTQPAQNPPAQRQTLMALPSSHLSTPFAASASDQRTSRTPGMTQLLPLRLPHLQIPSENTHSPPEDFASFLPPPLTFQPSAAPSSIGAFTVPWAQQMSCAPQYIPPPDSSPAHLHSNSNSVTPKRTPSSHHGVTHHHVSFADAPPLETSAHPPQSPLSRSASSVPQSPSAFSVPAAELTVDLEAGGIVREREHSVAPSPAAVLFTPHSAQQRPLQPYPQPILHHPVQQYTAQTLQHQQYSYVAQQYHADHEDFRADSRSLHAILNTAEPSKEMVPAPPKRRETALGPPMRIPLKAKPQSAEPPKVNLNVESSPARAELARRMARDLSDSRYTPSRAGPVSRLTFTAGSVAQPFTPNRSSALPMSYGTTPLQLHTYSTPHAVAAAPSPRPATQQVTSINGVAYLPASGMVPLTPQTLHSLNTARPYYQ